MSPNHIQSFYDPRFVQDLTERNQLLPDEDQKSRRLSQELTPYPARCPEGHRLIAIVIEREEGGKANTDVKKQEQKEQKEQVVEKRMFAIDVSARREYQEWSKNCRRGGSFVLEGLYQVAAHALTAQTVLCWQPARRLVVEIPRPTVFLQEAVVA